MTANFKFEGFKNDNTFYTDSNGLNMQKRVLNYRPTWNISENYQDSNTNISANYYPVTSAIALVDTNHKVVVLNDRSQGGSSINEGEVELMQNRLIPANDGKGMDDTMVELDPVTKRPIRVQASYYVMIGIETNQRLMQ